MKKQHKCSKKLRKYNIGDPVYRDFFGQRFSPKTAVWCDFCLRWIPPSYYDNRGKPTYIHTCYDARPLEIAESDRKRLPMQIKLPKHWGEIRMLKPIICPKKVHKSRHLATSIEGFARVGKPNNRAVKQNKKKW